MKAKYKKYVAGGMIIGGAAQAAMGIGQTIYGMNQAKKSRNELNRLRSNAPSLETPSEWYNALKKSYDQTLMERQFGEINRQLATTTQALQQAGGRALVGGINEASRGAQMGMQQLADRQNQMQIGALTNLAGARERETGRKEDRSRFDQSLENQNLMAANAQIAGGIGAVGEGAFYAGMGAFENGNFNLRDKTPINKKIKTGALEADLESGALRDLTREEPIWEKGGMTNGKFDHKTNPIHMIQNGKKVGEATGGEAILNPKQQKQVAKQSPYFKALLNKFKKNK